MVEIKKHYTKVLIFVVCIILGFMISMQLKSTRRSQTVSVQRAEELTVRLQQVAELTIDGNHKLVLRMDYGFPVMLGPVNELAGKADLFMTVYNEMKGKNIQALYMDLEYSKPYVRLKSDAIEQQKIAAQQKQQQEQRAQQEKRRQQAVQKQKQEQQTKKQ